MAALKPTSFFATIGWLGRVPDRDASLRSTPAQRLDARFDDIPGEAHGGAIRPSCSRVSAQHPRGTPIRNVRQLTIVAAEDLAGIAEAIGVAAVDPAWIGAQMVLEGLPDLTHLPPSSRLQAPDGATLVVDMGNRPCHLPAREIERDAPGHGRAFREAAAGRRGITAWIEREGVLTVGDRLRLHVPDQPVWAHLDAARAG